MKISNKFTSLLIVLSVMPLAINSYSKNVDKNPFKAKLTLVQGNIFTLKNKKLVKLKVGSTLEVNQKIISSQKSKAEIVFPDKSKLRLNQNTEVWLSPDSSTKNKYSFLKVLKGQVWAKVINKGVGRFAIKAKNNVFAVMGTTFEVNIIPGKTEMSVFEGSVGVTGNEQDKNISEQIKNLNLKVDDHRKSSNSLQTYEIGKPAEIPPPRQISVEEWLEIVGNQKITIKDNGESSVELLDKDKKDSWTEWNKELDNKP